MIPLDNVKVCHLLLERNKVNLLKDPIIYADFFLLVLVPVHIQVIFPGVPIDIRLPCGLFENDISATGIHSDEVQGLTVTGLPTSCVTM